MLEQRVEKIDRNFEPPIGLEPALEMVMHAMKHQDRAEPPRVGLGQSMGAARAKQSHAGVYRYFPPARHIRSFNGIRWFEPCPVLVDLFLLFRG
jgi:hypothetical protein